MKLGKPSLLTVIILCAVVLQIGTANGQVSPGEPELPRQQVDTTYPANTRTPIFVPSGGDLQAAINSAVPGDTITLAPNGTYSAPGGFVLLNKHTNSKEWIIIRSLSTAFNGTGSIPPGTCVDGSNGSNTSQMPKVLSQVNNAPAISVEQGAHHYRLVGLELSMDSAAAQSSDATVQLGSRYETNVANQPAYMIVDRCYVHGKDGSNGNGYVRGVDLEGKYMAVIDSYISNYRADNDAQAIFGSNGAGPFGIYNNYLEASGENIMFGGDDPRVDHLVPADIEIKRNLLTKRLSWRNSTGPETITVKNLFELKNARRVLFDGNVLQNFWSDQHPGQSQEYAVNIKSANQGDACTWCVSEDVTVSNNKLYNVANGFDIGARDASREELKPPAVSRVKIYNNLIYNLLPSWGSPYGRIFRIRDGASYVKIVHVTAEGSIMALGVGYNFESNPALTFKDNIVERGVYGIKGDQEGTTALQQNFSPYTYQKNLWVNTSDEFTPPTGQEVTDQQLLGRYPNPAPAANNVSYGDTFVATTWSNVGFVDRASGNYRLAPTSIYRGQASDGKDIGVDQDAIEAAIGGTFRFSAASYTINEGANNTLQGFTALPITVVRSGNLSSSATVRYATSDQSGGNECDQFTGFASQRCDYTHVGGTLRFEPGEGQKTIYIPITNDGYVEGAESFTIQLQLAPSAVGASLGPVKQATITIQDNDATATAPANNPYLSNEFFVRQLYLDFLGRDADQAGFTDWTNVLNNCGAEKGFLGAPYDCDRAHVSHGFFGSAEFTDRGFLIYRLYEVGKARLPLYREFVSDMATLSGFGLPPEVQQQNLQDFLLQFSNDAEFINRFQSVSAPSQAAQLITMLEQTAGVTLPPATATQPGQPTQYGRDELIQKRASGQFSVIDTVKAFVEQQAPYDQYFPRAAVTMQYFAQLRRDPSLNDPELLGWKDWVDVFTNGRPSAGIQPRDIHHLIFGFIYSGEYRKRFGAP
jgi:hypothetical protein